MFPPSRKKWPHDLFAEHQTMLASTNICLSCYDERNVLVIHEKEKKQARSGWTGPSSFARGSV
jgi:hypothetical protein